MFPLPFSISPLLLSIFVLYPWALALGVWQVGKLTNRQSRPSSSMVREVGQKLVDGDSVTSRSGLLLTGQASVALPAVRLTDIPDLLVVGQLHLPCLHAVLETPAIAHRIPRAPPAIS